MRLDGTSTRVPVFGLRPTRGCRCLVRKLPKPRISILSPVLRERTMLSKMASTITSESFLVISTTRDTSSINSALVMLTVVPFSTDMHCLFYCHSSGCGLSLVVFQAGPFLLLGNGAEAQADFLFGLIPLD